MDRNAKLAALFLCVFALPFAGFGLFALGTAIHQMLTGTGDSKVWLALIFGLVFTAIGVGLMSAVVFSSRSLKQQQQAQAEHPAEPWLWRKDWAQGRIRGSTKSGMIGSWIIATLWNLISAPILFFVPQQAAHNPLAYVGLMFPLIGVFLLFRAVRLTRVFLAFGTTWLEVTPVPGVIGGELRGTIQTRFLRPPDQGVRLRLSCFRRETTGSGDDQTTSERIQWRGESILSSGQLYPGPNGSSIPVNFRIPWDAQPSETRSARDAIVWQLEATAEVFGVDYRDLFEVPVFRTAQTPTHPTETAAATLVALRPAKPTIEVRHCAQGVEFYFPPARNSGFALGVTAFLLIFGSIPYFLVTAHAPVIFALGFGSFSLLLLYISLQMWLGTTRVGIGNGELLLQDGFLGGGKVQHFPLSGIESITSKIKAQQGGGNGTPYYDIEMTLRAGKKVTLGRTLRNHHEVDWLLDEMRRLVTPQSKATTASTS